MKVMYGFKLRNKAICCLLIALMVLTALPMSAFADQTYKQNTVTENANTATVPTVSEEKSSDLNELPESEKSSDKELIKQDKKDPAIELKLKLTKEVPFDIPKEKSVPEPQTVYLTLPGEGYQPYRDSVIYQTLKDKGMLDIFDQLIQHEANPADEQLPEEIVPEVEKDPNGPTPEDPEQPTEANDPQEDDLDPDQGTSPEEGLLPENGDSHSGASGDAPVSSNEDENPLQDGSQPTQADNGLKNSENDTLLDDTDSGVAENQILLPDDLSLKEDGQGVIEEGENDESENAPDLANGKNTNFTNGNETENPPTDQNNTSEPPAHAGDDITELNNPANIHPPDPEAEKDKSEKENKKANRFSELEPLIGTDIVNLMSEAESQKAYYNTLVGPSAINGVVNEQYSALRDTDEVISPLSGDLTLKVTDIKLPGRNGLDLNLGRLYQSNQAMFGDRKIEGDGINGYNSHSTYFLDRYSLGVGWSLTLPSVQVEKDKADEEDEDDDAQELYYHTGDGAVYHVKFTDDPDDSNLEKYHRDDIRFEKDTTFNNTQVDSAYAVIRTDQTKTYFADDGRLLGIVDRFGNSIVFNHEELPVSNLVINGDFENPESRAWHSNEYRLPTDCFNYDTTFGKDDNSSLKYGYVWGKSSISETDYIAVEPNTNYYVSCYMNDQLSGGHTFVSVSQYRNLYGSGQGSAIRLDATEKNTWEFKEGFFTTGPNTHYVQVNFGGGNYSGYAWLDKVRLDKAWPLISKITDSIGREIDFEYTDTLNEDIGDAGTITVTVNNPDKTDSVNYTYTRNRNLITCGTGKEAYETRYSTLFSSDNGDTCNTYEYNCQDVSWKFDVGATPTSGIQALLSNASVRNSKIQYDYTKKSKFLGNFGSHEVYRVSSRREFPQLENDYSQTPRLVKNYSYEGALSVFNFNDETSYSSYHRNFYYTFTNANYTCTIQQDNGLETNIIFHGSPIGWVKDQIVKIKADGERDTTTFEEYDTKFKNQPVKISTKQYDATYNDALYTGYTYNDWGGIESETRPLTQTEWDDASAKEQHTISYTYDPIFKFLASKTYNQDEGIRLTESSIYDYNGRLQTTVNAKGETTDYRYEDDDHMGNVTKVLVNHEDGLTSTTAYDYSGAYDAYPTAITQFYTENNQAQSSTAENTYEFVRGLVTSAEDAAGNITGYEYDDQGRLTKVTYPSSVGINGSYVVEDNYDYGDYIVADLDNRSLFRVHLYRTWDDGSGPETFFETVGYYDDHGVLQQSRKYDFEKDQWITTQYGFNVMDRSYPQPTPWIIKPAMSGTNGVVCRASPTPRATSRYMNMTS
jgi:YD repeat-containing protein